MTQFWTGSTTTSVAITNSATTIRITKMIIFFITILRFFGLYRAGRRWRSQNGVGHASHIAHGADVVYAQHVGPSLDTKHAKCSSPRVASGGWHSKDVADDRFAGRSEKKRTGEAFQFRKMPNDMKVVVKLFREIETGIKQNLFMNQTCLHCQGDFLFKPGEHVGHHIGILDVCVWHLWFALRMHDDERSPVPGRETSIGVVGQATDVVDYMSACLQRGIDHFGAPRVYRDGKIREPRHQLFDGGTNAIDLLLFRDRAAIGSGRFTRS